MSVSEVGASVTYGETAALLRSLQREVGSHYYMARAGWSFPISLPELISIVHAEAFLNTNRDAKAQPKPFDLPRPWDGTKGKADVTADERVALTASLKRRSAFRENHES